MAAGEVDYEVELPILEEFIEGLNDLTGKMVAPRAVQRANDMISALLTGALDLGAAGRIDKLLELQERLSTNGYEPIGSVADDDAEILITIDYQRRTTQTSIDDSSSSSSSSSISFYEPTGPEECPICMEEFPPEEMRCLLSCGQHRYCSGCIEKHFTTLIEEAEMSKICCPNPNCQAVPAEYEMDNLVPAEWYEKWLQFNALALIKDDKNTKWCWNKECGQPITWDPSETKVVCPACKTEFCFDCSRALHPGLTCDGVPLPDAERLFQEWIAEKGILAKECPGCKNIIEKNAGCNHITCRCGYQFCWLCHAEYAVGHFGDGPCNGFQFATANSLEEAVAARDAQKKAQQERLEREEREREAAALAARERAAQQATLESLFSAPPPPPSSSSSSASRGRQRRRLFIRRE